MARYIDVDSLIPLDNDDALARVFEHYKKTVAKEIFDEIENNYADFLFDGCRNIVVLTEKDFAELKKKYTEPVHCKDCQHLMFSDHYGECSKGYRGIVSPEDSCEHGEKKI